MTFNPRRLEQLSLRSIPCSGGRPGRSVKKDRTSPLSSEYRIRRIALIAIVVFSTLALAQNSSADTGSGCQLVIHVDRIRNQNGALGATIFNSPDGWPEKNESAFRHGPFPITGSTGTAEFGGLPAGDYAIAVIHDENRNRKMDRNFLGWPLEGFGFANNPKVRLEAPAFREALVHVSCPVTETTIHMTYK